MNLRINQAGSHIIAIAVGIVILGVIGLAGYRVLQHDNPMADSAAKTPSVPASITSKDDLKQTAASLDGSSVDVNNSVDGSSLDENLTDML
ncbi:MAG: hypothetical protein JWM37_693 [Candidatus Saccharibacteria bacterium]|nr:hypothetical protein [Candidatus Saccharibacteria bacterium]